MFALFATHVLYFRKNIDKKKNMKYNTNKYSGL